MVLTVSWDLKVPTSASFETLDDLNDLCFEYLPKQGIIRIREAHKDGFFFDFLEDNGRKDLAERLESFRKANFETFHSAFEILYAAEQEKSVDLVPVGEYYDYLDKIFVIGFWVVHFVFIFHFI